MKDEDVEVEIMRYYSTRMLKALEKFRWGRKEHGQDLDTLDTDKEVEEEQIDEEVYRCIGRLQKAAGYRR